MQLMKTKHCVLIKIAAREITIYKMHFQVEREREH